MLIASFVGGIKINYFFSCCSKFVKLIIFVYFSAHITVHDLENTVTCSCGVVFKDTKALKRHEKKEHTEF